MREEVGAFKNKQKMMKLLVRLDLLLKTVVDFLETAGGRLGNEIQIYGKAVKSAASNGKRQQK